MGQKEFIVLMASLSSLVALSIDAILPAMGLLANFFKLSDSNSVQLVVSFIFLGMAIGQLICGPLSDALGRKTVLLYSFSVYIFGVLVCVLSSSFEIFLLGRFIQGLGAAGPNISASSIIRDNFAGSQMAKILSFQMTIFIMVPAIAPLIGQGLLFLGSWHYIFIFYLLYCIFQVVWIIARLQESLPIEKRVAYSLSNIKKGLLTVVNSKYTLRYMLAMGLSFSTIAAYLNSVQQIMQVQFNQGNLFAAYFSIQALSLGVASLINARLVDIFPLRSIVLSALFLMSLISIVFLFIYFNIGIGFGLFFTYGLLLFFLLGYVFGNLNALVLRPLGHIAGLASSLINAASLIIGSMVGLVISQLYDGTVMPIILGFFIVHSLGVSIIFYGQREESVT